jgi:hypothetical protein
MYSFNECRHLISFLEDAYSAIYYPDERERSQALPLLFYINCADQILYISSNLILEYSKIYRLKYLPSYM